MLQHTNRTSLGNGGGDGARCGAHSRYGGIPRRLRISVVVNETQHASRLVDVCVQPPLENHVSSSLLRDARLHTKQGAKLFECDAFVHHGCGDDVVLDDAAAEHRAPISRLGELVRLERGCERIHDVRLQEPPEVNALEDGMRGESRRALVFVQSCKHAAPLRPRGGENGTRHRRLERLHELRIVDARNVAGRLSVLLPIRRA
mmetsp:Transcript_319/g.693  ORF Transcript_319/g.693 Transcript_319/m.693 type:complete len:203 (-) Transcript_319:159-767(-)